MTLENAVNKTKKYSVPVNRALTKCLSFGVLGSERPYDMLINTFIGVGSTLEHFW